MAKLNFQLKAGTLMESIVAMIILVLVFFSATTIYSNVLASDKQRMELKGILILNREAIQTKVEKSFLDAEKQIGELTIKKTVEKYEQTENLYKLALSLVDKSGNIIARRNELISIE